MTTREEIKDQARKLGEMLAEAGDFYDVAEPFAEGYGVAASTSGGDVLRQRIVALNALQSAANEVLKWRVEDARPYVSWQAIGDALEISRQAAQQRFGGESK